MLRIISIILYIIGGIYFLLFGIFVLTTSMIFGFYRIYPLLPILTRNMSNDLYYSVTTALSTINRGTFNDTRLSTTDETYDEPPAGTDPGPSDVYKAFSTPSGSAVVHQPYYLIL